MSFKYRIKTYKDEEGEYSEYFHADKSLILSLIYDHWMNKSVPNGLEIISITNGLGENLLLEHFKKDVFDVYYLPQIASFHFHKKSRIEIVFNSIDLFFANELIELENILNKTNRENKYIRGDYFFINHNYGYANKRSVREGLWLIYALPMGLAISYVGVISFYAPNYFINILAIFFFFMGFYFWVPGLLLHLQYKRDNEDLIIRVTKGQELISVKWRGVQRELFKKDLLAIIKYENPFFKIPWSEYGYIHMAFKGGEYINITNLLCDQLFILEKFSNSNVKKLIIKKYFPSIIKNTNL
ncbi:MAG: hypothetical protein O9294_15770 [Cytophagales bacterium]|nr:hypothetical protein [Cytophagales bacterium]